MGITASGIRGRTAAIAAISVVAAVAIAGSAQAEADDDTTAGTAGTGSPTTSWVYGIGGGELDFEGYEGDPVSFRIQGHTTEADLPLSVQGSFHVTHDRPDGTPYAKFSGQLDCLSVGGDVAVATGVIDTADLPGLPEYDIEGKRVGFTISDAKHGDRIGWSWAVLGFEEDAPLCMGTAPFFEIEHGGFTVGD